MKSDIFKKAFQKFDEEKSKQEIKQEDSYFTEIRKSIAETEEENGFISLHIINNDYSPLQDRNKIKWLFDVQRLFSIQLPKMPREYVTRIVFDRTHTNLIIHKKDKGIIAGICYRLFKEQGFAEIVFCAVMADEQVKGYGTHMMNHLKDYMVGKLGIYHLLTYADEFAIGYFIKQDFITEFALPASKYKGYIKDYQGATLMYCQLHPKLIYIKSKQIYHNMRRIYTLALKEAFPNYGMQFGGLKPLFDKNGGQPLSLKQIPGTEILSNIEDLKKAEEEHEKYQQTGETLQKNFRLILQKLKEDKNSWPFKESVDSEKVPDYKNIINFPIDLSIITQKLKDGFYTCDRMFIADLKRLFFNCYKFNSPNSQYYFHGFKLNEHCLKLCKTYFPHSKLQPTLPEIKPQYIPLKIMLNKFFSYNNSFFMIKKLFIFLFLSINGFLGERIPGVAEIDQYDDPMLDEIFKETNSDIQKSENVASSIIQPQQQSLQTFNSQNQHQLPINSEKLNSAASSVINPNIKPPPSGSSFPTEFNGQQQQQNAFGIFQNPYGGGFNQYNNNNIFARTPLTDFAYQAGQTFYSGVKQASRLLGIDSGQYQPYEVPLLSQSTRFFGKRK